MKDTIRSYFENLPAYRQNPFQLQDDDSLIQLGLLDSFGIVELIRFLEDAFKLEVDPDDMKREHFESITAIGYLIAGKHKSPDSTSPKQLRRQQLE